MRRGLVTGVLGRFLLGAGTLILLFVAYQLWGTGIAESHSQDVLRQRFEAELHAAHTHPPRTTVPPSTSTTGPGSSSSTSVTTSSSGAGDEPTVGPTTRAPGEGSPVGFLTIPKVGLRNAVIIEGTGTDDLRQGPGHYVGTPLPGEAGNAAIAGHRTTYGAPFYDLDRLGRGDPVYVQTIQGSFTYTVSSSQVVSPSDSAVVSDTKDNELTLTTCNPRFSASTRLIVHAVLSGNEQPAPTLPPAQAGGAHPAGGAHRASAAGSAGAAGLAGSQGDWAPALELGVVAAVVITATFVVARGRRRRVRRWGVYAVGGVASLAALFFFFGAVSPLLPASF